MALSPTSSRGAAVAVTDGTHSVAAATTVDFTSGATVTDAGSGQANVAVAASAISLISTVTRATTGTLDLSGISQAYTHLLIIAVTRGTVNAANEDLFLRINNDSTTSTYGWTLLRGSGSAASSSGGGGAGAGLRVASMSSASDTAGVFGQCAILIPGYTSTTWDKGVTTWAGSWIGGTANTWVNTGTYANTAAVTQVTLYGSATASLAIGSTMSVYGIS